MLHEERGSDGDDEQQDEGEDPILSVKREIYEQLLLRTEECLPKYVDDAHAIQLTVEFTRMGLQAFFDIDLYQNRGSITERKPTSLGEKITFSQEYTQLGIEKSTQIVFSLSKDSREKIANILLPRAHQAAIMVLESDKKWERKDELNQNFEKVQEMLLSGNLENPPTYNSKNHFDWLGEEPEEIEVGMAVRVWVTKLRDMLQSEVPEKEKGRLKFVTYDNLALHLYFNPTTDRMEMQMNFEYEFMDTEAAFPFIHKTEFVVSHEWIMKALILMENEVENELRDIIARAHTHEAIRYRRDAQNLDLEEESNMSKVTDGHMHEFFQNITDPSSMHKDS